MLVWKPVAASRSISDLPVCCCHLSVFSFLCFCTICCFIFLSYIFLSHFCISTPYCILRYFLFLSSLSRYDFALPFSPVSSSYLSIPLTSRSLYRNRSFLRIPLAARPRFSSLRSLRFVLCHSATNKGMCPHPLPQLRCSHACVPLSIHSGVE